MLAISSSMVAMSSEVSSADDTTFVLLDFLARDGAVGSGVLSASLFCRPSSNARF